MVKELAHSQIITVPALIADFHFTTGQQAWVSAAQESRLDAFFSCLDG
jgi:hypothetical protein